MPNALRPAGSMAWRLLMAWLLLIESAGSPINWLTWQTNELPAQRPAPYRLRLPLVDFYGRRPSRPTLGK